MGFFFSMTSVKGKKNKVSLRLAPAGGVLKWDLKGKYKK